jgi:hypothetical protein
VTNSTINKRALELICHSYSHNCIRLVVRKFGEGVQVQLLQLGFWLLVGLSLGYGLDFLLGLWCATLGERCTTLVGYCSTSGIILSVKVKVFEGGLCAYG